MQSQVRCMQKALPWLCNCSSNSWYSFSSKLRRAALRTWQADQQVNNLFSNHDLLQLARIVEILINLTEHKLLALILQIIFEKVLQLNLKAEKYLFFLSVRCQISQSETDVNFEPCFQVPLFPGDICSVLCSVHRSTQKKNHLFYKWL